MLNKKVLRIFYYLIILLAVVLFCEKFIVNTLLKKDAGYQDFTSYFIAADALKNGGSPYAALEIGENYIANKVKPEDLARMGIEFSVPEKFAYTYPPILAGLLIPLAFFKYQTAFFIWHIINLVIFFFAVFLTLRVLGSKPLSLITALTFLLFMGTMPSYETFSLGQINFLVYVLCLLAFIYNDGKSSKCSAFFLALACIIKVTPVVLLLYFVFFTKRKRFFLYFAGFGVVLLFLCGVLAGMESFWHYLTFILPKLSGSYLLDNNKALVPLFSRVFAFNPMVTPLFVSKTAVAMFTVALSSVLLFVTSVILWRAKKESSYEARVLGFSVALVFMLLAQTLLEIHHLIYAFLPLLALLHFSKLKPGMKIIMALPLIILLNTRGWNAMEKLGTAWWVVFLTAPQILGLILLMYFLHLTVESLRTA